MPRRARNTTSTGIYHVMMRGINHQVIFEDEEDNHFFLDCLFRMGFINDDDGTPIAQGCTYYAYCLMGNHFHLLIREREETISQTLKRIADAYVYYYNRKYQRSGHLFKERFRSEPVNDMDYFTTLLCYIHQNPVKAGIVANVKDYAYSSWREYTGEVFPQAQICHIEAVLRRMPFEELNELVNTPLPEKMGIIDIEDEVVRHRLSEEQVKHLLVIYSQTHSASEFQQLGRPRQSEIINILRNQGASIRQLERLTGLSRGLISRL